MKNEELVKLFIPYLKKKGWIEEKLNPLTYEKILRIAELERDRLN